MANSIFIAPGDSSLGQALCDEAARSGFKVVAAMSSFARTTEGEAGADGTETSYSSADSEIPVVWNRRSLLSARNAVLTAINEADGIDVAIVIHEPEAGEGPTHELAPVEIERRIDEAQKSTFYIVRELLSCFVRQQSGMLSFVHFTPHDIPGLPMAVSASSAFRGAASALFSLYQNEDMIINGFECARDKPQAFAKLILQTVQSKAVHGKWYRLGGGGRQGKTRFLRG